MCKITSKHGGMKNVLSISLRFITNDLSQENEMCIGGAF
jgi:hypothetical protein